MRSVRKMSWRTLLAAGWQRRWCRLRLRGDATRRTCSCGGAAWTWMVMLHLAQVRRIKIQGTYQEKVVMGAQGGSGVRGAGAQARQGEPGDWDSVDEDSDAKV